MIALLRRLARARRGAAVVEFALVAPVLILTLLGLFDLGYTMYTAQMLHGAIQDAARRSSLQGAPVAAPAIDAIVTRAVRAVAPGATLTFRRSAYASFSEVGRPEDFTDIDGNGACNGGEPFEDANGNGTWDADRGTAGFGGARDAVLYTVSVSYPRAFPLTRLVPGFSPVQSLVATTVLRNQPFDLQAVRPPVAGNCP